MSAVSPKARSAAFGSAPCFSSSVNGSGRPVRAAAMSTVSPSPDAAFGSAPARSSKSIMSALPLTAASASGVTP